MSKSSVSRNQRRGTLPEVPKKNETPNIDQATAQRIQDMIQGKEAPPSPIAKDLVERLQASKSRLETLDRNLSQARAQVTMLEQNMHSVDGRMGAFIDLLRGELAKIETPKTP